MRTCAIGYQCLASLFFFVGSLVGDESVEKYLLNSDTAKLVDQCKSQGNPSRGAIFFYSPSVGCFQCHAMDDRQDIKTGPNLAMWKRVVDDSHLIQSVLVPSKVIAEGFQTTKFLTQDQRVVTGIVLAKNADEYEIATGPTSVETLKVDEIEEETASSISLMPAGQVQALSSPNDFYDLIAYLIAVRDGGPTRAAELRPSPESLKLRVPEYEAIVDHAGMIQDFDEKAFDRGAEIYRGLCINCHGTLEMPGSLPTALRFGAGKFKRGSDPYSMYHTLTHGSGQMLPQIWMVPQQKYDVTHYIREHFLKPHNVAAWTNVDQDYLASLPRGSTRGPAPKKLEPWRTMDYGAMLTTSVEFGNSGENIAQKSICIRLDPGVGGVASGHAWMSFEHDTLRMAGAWSGQGFIDWQGIQFNGAHGIHPRAVGDIVSSNPTAPGWAMPGTTSFEDDQRVVGRDGKRYGPLPKEWGKFRGVYRNGDSVLLSYTVGGTAILETPEWALVPGSDSAGQPELEIFGRSFQIGARPKFLTLSVHTSSSADWELKKIGDAWCVQNMDGTIELMVSEKGLPSGAKWMKQDRRLCVSLPANDQDVRFSIAFSKLENRDQPDKKSEEADSLIASAATLHRQATSWTSINLEQLKAPGSPLWSGQALSATVGEWFSGEGWGVDEIKLPTFNPWQARLRVTGIDFVPETDSAVICTWDGDVWKATGLAQAKLAGDQIQWRRIATGLFQPLGIIADRDTIMLTCRDQLVRLHDNNGDEEIDFYECFNSDQQVTEHFHEFAMGLQRDGDGNWYYAKSARHALPAVVPHHGTLLRVDPQGQGTDILATGFRAANGVCLNPDGTFIVTDQEGHWNPKNRINWVRPGGFYGNMYGYHDVTDSSDSAMEQPLCWITNEFDRSPAELLWVPKDHWGQLSGSLLNLSYGYGRVYVVPFEDIDGVKQGGMCQLPIPDLPTGIIRGRFSPVDQSLYVGGMFAWASSRQDQEGGLFRIRHLGQPVNMPVGLHIHPKKLEIVTSDLLDRESNKKLARYRVRVWSLKRTANYGSEHYDEHELEITDAKVLADGKTVILQIPKLETTMGMSISLDLRTKDGREVRREIHNTINVIPEGDNKTAQ